MLYLFQVSIPVCNDQGPNAVESVRLGIGKMIEFKDVTEENLFEAITEVLENPEYKQNVQAIGDHLLDQETSPLDRATWWMEYIARHPGQHFRSPAHDLSWVQLHSLDVIAAGIAIIFATIFILWTILKAIVFSLFFKPDLKVKSSKKRN